MSTNKPTNKTANKKTKKINKTDKVGRKKMPIKIIMYIIVMVVVAIFLGINGTNSCDINLMFKKFTDVPVITTILISFAAGIFVMLPFTFGRKKKNKTQASTEDTKSVHKTVSPKKVKKSIFGKKKSKKVNSKDAEALNKKSTDSAVTNADSFESKSDESKNDKK